VLSLTAEALLPVGDELETGVNACDLVNIPDGLLKTTLGLYTALPVFVNALAPDPGVA
jgi:hypothetical protein